MAHDDTPILDLSTLTEDRPPIQIDGTRYHLKSPEELSLFETQQFSAWGKELETLGADPSKREALEALVCIVARSVLADVPSGVAAKLSSSQLMSIVEVFTGLLLGRRLQLAGALGKQLGRSIGGKSSPDSSTSTAAILATGSTAPQPQS